MTPLSGRDDHYNPCYKQACRNFCQPRQNSDRTSWYNQEGLTIIVSILAMHRPASISSSPQRILSNPPISENALCYPLKSLRRTVRSQLLDHCPGNTPKVRNLSRPLPEYPVIDSGRGTTRAEDVQGTPTQSHISPSILVYEE